MKLYRKNGWLQMTANLKKTKILIDTDPGDDIDDEFALLLAAKSP